MAVWIEPVTLEGEHVVLEPLATDHAEALADATADGELWKLWYTFVPSPDQVTAYIDTALKAATGTVTCRSRSATGKAGG